MRMPSWWLGALWGATTVSMSAALWMVFRHAPEEKVMGAAQKIFYFHLPLAFVTYTAVAVLLGGSIFVIGFWLANIASQTVSRASGEKTSGLAQLARLAILGLVIAMGLRAMGIADDIVNLAFGLTLGAVAIAFALSFGLGGREAAGRQMEHWLSRLRQDD